MNDIIKIAITGPESTGKTKLSRDLASHYHSIFVPEYSREYLTKTGGRYRYEDLVKIARGQVSKEGQMIKKAKKLLFCDSDLILHKIWSEVRFGKVHHYIIEKILEKRYDLYLLCKPDIAWEEDPLRQNKDDRDALFQLFIDEYENYQLPYFVISGQGDNRLQNALKIIDNFILENKHGR